MACNSSSSNNDGNNDNDDTPVLLSGTAATGAPIAGHIQIRDAMGQLLSNVVINADGSFEADVGGMTAPFMLAAIPNNAGLQTQYSYAPAPGTVNITPLTTWALYLATNGGNLATLFQQWSPGSAPSASAVQDAAAQLMQHFADLFVSLGSNFNLFSTPFAANNQGFDAILDGMSILFNWASGVVTVNGNTVNVELDPGTITPPVTGNYLLRVTTTVYGISTATDIPDMPKPASQAEFCSAANYEIFQADLDGSVTINSCSFNGNSSAINATVSMVTGGVSINVTYDVLYEYFAQ